MSDIIGIGSIERFEGDVAWGTFDTGTTFDLPIGPTEHDIGDEVQFMNCDPSETGSPYFMMVIGARQATVFWLDETEEGYEIMDSDVFLKEPGAHN